MTPPASDAMTMDLDTPLRRLLATMTNTVSLRMAVKALTETQEDSTSLTPPAEQRMDERNS